MLKGEIPLNRNRTFEPQIVPRYWRRFTGFDEKILSMFALGLGPREIQGPLY